ncbi:MAG: hypothetical protein KDK39_11450, partial [Leptospiraceae bacterium]|nr:hypothetical protein [Leptospiraceae bacterium]
SMEWQLLLPFYWQHERGAVDPAMVSEQADTSSQAALSELLVPFYYRFDRQTRAVKQRERLWGPVYSSYSRRNVSAANQKPGETGLPTAAASQSAGETSSLHVWPLYFSWDGPETRQTLYGPFAFHQASHTAAVERDEWLLILPLPGYLENWQQIDDQPGVESPTAQETASDEPAAEQSKPALPRGHYSWVLPLWLHESRSDRQSQSRYHFNLLSGYYAASESAAASETEYLNLLFWSHNRNHSTDNGELRYDRSLLTWPGYYQNRSSDSNVTVLWSAYYRHDNQTDEWSHRGLAPFYFHKQGADGYLHVLPVYLSFQDAETFHAYGLLHYQHKSPGQQRWWLGPWFEKSDEIEQRYQTHVVPFYFSWFTPHSRGNITVPLYMDYEDNTKTWQANISGSWFGHSTTYAEGINADQPVVHIDDDLVFVLNLFSISTRVTLGEAAAQKVEASQEKIFPDPIFEQLPDEDLPDNRRFNQYVAGDKAALQRQRDPSQGRANSLNFYEWTALFGLFASQKSDTYRHFRMLPLSWLSYDEATAQDVNIWPFYVDYDSPDVSYRAIFPAFVPVYGYQRAENSWIEAWGLMVWVSEFDAVADRRERSFLWPFVNWYDSPEQSGYRIIPFVWHKEKYSLSAAAGDTGEDQADNQTKSQRGDLIASYTLAPFYFAAADTGGSWSTLVPLYWQSAETVHSADGSALQSSTWLALPLLYSRTITEQDTARRREHFYLGWYAEQSLAADKQSLWFGLWHFNRQYQNRAAINADAPVQSSSLGLLYSVYRSDWSADQSESWLLPVYYSRQSSSERDGGRMVTSEFIGLWLWYSDTSQFYSAADEPLGHPANRSESYRLGWYHYESADSSEDSLLFGFYSQEQRFSRAKDKQPGIAPAGRQLESSATSFLYGLVNWESDAFSSEQMFLPLFYSAEYKTERDEGRMVASEFLGLWLWYSDTLQFYDMAGQPQSHPENLAESYRLGWYQYQSSRVNENSLLFGLFKQRTDFAGTGDLDAESTVASRSRTSMLYGLFAWESAADTSRENHLFPVYAYQSDADGSSHYSILHYYNASASERTLLLPLLYQYDSATVTERFYGNTWYSHDSSTDESSLYVWPVYWTWQEQQSRSHLLAGLYWKNAPDYSHQNLLGIVYDREYYSDSQRSDHCLFLCAFSYESDPDRWKMHTLGGYLLGAGHDSEYSQWNFDLLNGYLSSFETETTRSEWTLLWMSQRHYDEHKMRSQFYPFWYWKQDFETGAYDYVLPPLLSWGVSHTDWSEHYWILGGAYYHDLRPREWQGSEMLLLGLAWTHSYKPERRYERMGSLWGWLWEYQSEADTGYNKFSIVKFIFSRTEKQGQTRYRLLGIPLN